jgi:hypothetical protein
MPRLPVLLDATLVRGRVSDCHTIRAILALCGPGSRPRLKQLPEAHAGGEVLLVVASEGGRVVVHPGATRPALASS